MLLLSLCNGIRSADILQGPFFYEYLACLDLRARKQLFALVLPVMRIIGKTSVEIIPCRHFHAFRDSVS